MNPIFLRYAGIALIAAVFGVGGGYLAKNDIRPTPSSGTTVAIPAQPFPGQGIRAIPAVPAQPQKGKPDIGITSISYIQGEADKNQVVDPMLTWWGTTNKIIGSNFSDKNTIYWDGKILVRDMPSTKNSDGTEEIYLPIPTDTILGSFHDVYVKSPPYGTSNTVQVQAVEHLDVPTYIGVNPISGPIGTKGKAMIWDGLEYGFNPSATDLPLSAKIYFGLTVPASTIKSGAEGFANVFIPTPLERSTSNPTIYSFTVPSQAIYCPSWAWDAKECTLAPANTMVPITGGLARMIFFIYDFQYRGTVKGFGNSWDGLSVWPEADRDVHWFGSFTVTP